MVSDDKNTVYKNINKNKRLSSSNNYPKSSSKFVSVPSSERISLYDAICSDCHAEVKVNFQPVSDKPFYCDYCFNSHKLHDHRNNI